jgi:hypothetical protein
MNWHISLQRVLLDNLNKFDMHPRLLTNTTIDQVDQPHPLEFAVGHVAPTNDTFKVRVDALSNSCSQRGSERLYSSHDAAQPCGKHVVLVLGHSGSGGPTNKEDPGERVGHHHFLEIRAQKNHQFIATEPAFFAPAPASL